MEAPALAPSRRWLDAFSREEIRELRRVSNLRGALAVIGNWGLIAAAMAAVVWSPLAALPVVLLVAAFIIGARQLGLAIVMHDAAHRMLFSNRWWNDRVTNWLVAYPVYLSLDLYRPAHLQHHAHTGTAEDPDLELATGWPVSKASMRRKILRDLTGVTGYKRLVVQTRFLWRAARGGQGLHSQVASFVGPEVGRDEARRTLLGVAVTQLALLGLLWAVGHPLLYLLWLGCWLTTYGLCLRIRSIAEHALTGDIEDPLRNTRTVTAGFWERLFLAPNWVNYHLEHHLLMTVPMYRLPRFHRLLRERGQLEDACIEPGYVAVLKKVTS